MLGLIDLLVRQAIKKGRKPERRFGYHLGHSCGICQDEAYGLFHSIGHTASAPTAAGFAFSNSATRARCFSRWMPCATYSIAKLKYRNERCYESVGRVLSDMVFRLTFYHLAVHLTRWIKNRFVPSEAVSNVSFRATRQVWI